MATKNKLGFIITWDWVQTLPYVTEMHKRGLDVHIITFDTGTISQDVEYKTIQEINSLSKKHLIKEPTAQGMDCIGPLLSAVKVVFELAKEEKKDIDTIVNTLTIPKIWNFDTTIDNWKKIFWFQWDHKEYADDVVVRTWNSIKPKPQPIKAVESTEE